MTNYERIRAMTIEEMAGYITQLDVMNGICLEYERLGCIDRPDDDPIPDEMCLACAIRWLNEEAAK